MRRAFDVIRLAGVTILLAAAAAWVTVPNSGAAPAIPGKGEGKDPARAITSELICPCSCGEIVSGCICETGIAMKGFVSDALKDGKGKDDILASLVSKYGEVILGAPKAKGFNLVVWIAPFAATLVGIVIATLVLRRWVRPRAAVPAAAGAVPFSAPAPSGQDRSALRARAEAELRRVRE